MHAGHRLVIAGSSSLSAGSVNFVKMKNNLRYIHVGRRFTNWEKVTETQKVYGRFSLAGCTVPILQGLVSA